MVQNDLKMIQNDPLGYLEGMGKCPTHVRRLFELEKVEILTFWVTLKSKVDMEKWRSEKNGTLNFSLKGQKTRDFASEWPIRVPGTFIQL